MNTEETENIIRLALEMKNSVSSRTHLMALDKLYKALDKYELLNPLQQTLIQPNICGNVCKHCNVIMTRKRHAENFVPDSSYYKEWDICPSCKRLYHYKQFFVKMPKQKTHKAPHKKAAFGMIQPPANTVFFEQSKSDKPPWEE